jgi:hypothetical protein
MTMQATLLESIKAMLPAVDESHANAVLAATLRQLSAGIDYSTLVVTEGEAPDVDVDPFAGMDLGLD